MFPRRGKVLDGLSGSSLYAGPFVLCCPYWGARGGVTPKISVWRSAVCSIWPGFRLLATVMQSDEGGACWEFRRPGVWRILCWSLRGSRRRSFSITHTVKQFANLAVFLGGPQLALQSVKRLGIYAQILLEMANVAHSLAGLGSSAKVARSPSARSVRRITARQCFRSFTVYRLPD